MTSAEIARLYEQYGFVIFGRCRRILRSEDDARDALQTVFLRLLECGSLLRDPQRVVPWIYRTAQNYCFNFLRDRKKFDTGADPDELPQEPGTEERLDARQIIRLALGCHDRRVREAVYFTYVEELGQEEIRAITGQSPATIRRNLRKFDESLPELKRKVGVCDHR